MSEYVEVVLYEIMCTLAHKDDGRCRHLYDMKLQPPLDGHWANAGSLTVIHYVKLDDINVRLCRD